MARRVRDIGFKYKLILLFSVALSILVVFVGVAYYRIGTEIINDLSQSNFITVNGITEQMINGYMNDLSYSFFNDYKKSVLNNSNYSLDGLNSRAKRHGILKELSEVSQFNSNVIYLQYTAPDGSEFLTNNAYWQNKYLFKPDHDLSKEEERLRIKHGRCVWERVDDTCFCFKRALFSTMDLSYRGCIVAGIHMDFFRDITRMQHMGENEGFVLLDCNRQIMYAKNDTIRKVVGEMLNRREADPDATQMVYELAYEGQHYQIRGKHWTDTDLYFLSVMDVSAIHARNETLMHRLIIPTAICFMGAMILVFAFSSSWSGKIRNIISHASADGTIEPFPQVPSRGDEMKQLVAMFGAMNDKLNTVMRDYTDEKERAQKAEFYLLESKYQAMQLAMNPHSLYNILESIYSMAMLEDCENVAEMVHLLAHYMRNSLRRVGRIETLGSEIEHAMIYLRINKVLLGDRLEYSCDVPEKIRERTFPSMILVPIVENAIVHGIERKPEGGHVCISAWEADGELWVQVKDDGMGIPEGSIDEALNGRVQPEQDKHLHIGISNVRERLKLLYGSAGYIKLASRENEGTVIQIVVPLISMDGKGWLQQ